MTIVDVMSLFSKRIEKGFPDFIDTQMFRKHRQEHSF